MPRSNIIIGAPYSCIPATASTTKSLPSCAGLSITMLKPVFIPGPIIIASQPVIFFIALFIVIVTVGTTDDIIAPSILEKSML